MSCHYWLPVGRQWHSYVIREFRLQEKLIENSYGMIDDHELIPDGYFGQDTEKAVMKYQYDHPELRNEPRGIVTILMKELLGPWEEEWVG